MILSIFLAVASMAQGADGVAPVVGEDVAAVLRVDLARLDFPSFSRRILGKMADDDDVIGITRVASGLADRLKKAGATELFVLLDLADMPGYPVAAVPLVAGADARAIADVLKSNPIRFPGVETIRGVVVGGSPAALARIKGAKRAARTDLAAALSTVGDAPIGLAIVPGLTLRRSVEESMPSLPTTLGGSPISTISRGLSWVSVAMAAEPQTTLKVVIQARDADAAKALENPLKAGFRLMAQSTQADPATAELAGMLDQIKPEAKGDRITIEADLEKSAALVSVPIRQSREAVLRSECVNNLKQIGLAMHNYHSTYNSFPPAYSTSKDGKPLLSWRVLVLPFLEQKELFDQFHLDEAWDSPHNKALLPRMPRTYVCPMESRVLLGEFKTSYLTPRGPNTTSPGAVAIKIQEITDGTSNTIMAVDASDESAVPWTKPDDWAVTPSINFKAVFGHHRNGTFFALNDGAVRFLKDTITPKVLQALTTRNGGEIIRSDEY